ncbi:clusterin isoform X1 [Xenopus laevis]|uniref:Clusterin n=2 Tax=Xenopus laevis TaxID=8355 RepID=Q7ZWW4_XENLA|nr:clusterin precursor [Xenopus laevis]XP_018117166.1 clusterin isoform X1 [Xenopus laevis]XP_041418022.1 clusterin isoform X1 [Xenopus laevis]AAH46678.1 Clu-prov protein [Xenopus laevis]OCT81554.1 hypothetical protein XELAEV_18028377mg [Xenopus laevis]
MNMYKFPFLLVGLLVGLSAAVLPPENLNQISIEGSRYITEQVENAVNGVKKMKSIMDQTGKEHQEIMRNLEETKKNKEEALKRALDTEQELEEKKEVCNETMLALWEECKPCLKQTCVRFYSKTCRSGSGLVGRQFEEFLNRSSPFSIFINGEKINSLTQEGEQQHMTLDDLEGGYSLVEDSVDELFRESIKAFGQMKPFFSNSFHNGFFESQWNPFPFQRVGFPFSESRQARSPTFNPYFSGNFESLIEAAQKMMERSHHFVPRLDGLGSIRGNGNDSDDKLVCKELRRNSASCLKMQEKCEKCKEILAVDCTGKDPVQEHLQEVFQDSLRLAEKFTRQYDDLLEQFREKMFNTTGILEQLNKQFGWLSKFANMTQSGKNGIFQVSTIYSKEGESPSDTKVTVNVFDSDPITFTLPGYISMDDPMFGELVAEEALKKFKTEVVEAA